MEKPTKHIGLNWDLDSTHMELAAQVRTELRNIVDPELGYNIIELGLVRNLAIGGGKASVTMILTTPFCPYGPAMLKETGQRIAAVLQMPTTIEMGAEMWEPELMEEGVATDWGLY